MEGKINTLNRFKFSLSPKKYIYLVKDSLGKAILYLLLLATILGAFAGITGVTILTAVEKSTEVAFKDDKLKFEMKDGILEFAASPLKEEEGKILLLIDTNKVIGEVDSLRNVTVHKELSTVFLKDGFMVKNGTNEMIYKYSELGLDKFDFNNETIIEVVKGIGVLKYLIIPIIILIKFFDLIFYALMISLAGALSILLNKQKVSYANIFKLAIYSMTLPTLISVILPLGKYTVLIGSMLLIFGLNYVVYNKKEENTN